MLLDDPVELLDVEGNPVRVTGRGLFSSDPVRLTGDGRSGRLSWWAGPWSVDERWWDSGNSGKAGRTARVQVLLEDPDDREDVTDRAMLLCYRQRQWFLEGVYE